MLARLAARLLRGPGVRFIFLRRGLAKEEFMPFLSDIDITVITDNDASKMRAENKLRKLTRFLPMLEVQSPVLTMKEFGLVVG